MNTCRKIEKFNLLDIHVWRFDKLVLITFFWSINGRRPEVSATTLGLTVSFVIGDDAKKHALLAAGRWSLLLWPLLVWYQKEQQIAMEHRGTWYYISWFTSVLNSIILNLAKMLVEWYSFVDVWQSSWDRSSNSTVGVLWSEFQYCSRGVIPTFEY